MMYILNMSIWSRASKYNGQACNAFVSFYFILQIGKFMKSSFPETTFYSEF